MHRLLLVLFTVGSILLNLHQAQPIPAACERPVAIIQNGLDAFASGTPQIGYFTDAGDYFAAGLVWVELSCGFRIDPAHFTNTP
jgi:hypothetical protein